MREILEKNMICVRKRERERRDKGFQMRDTDVRENKVKNGYNDRIRLNGKRKIVVALSRSSLFVKCFLIQI